MRTTTAVAVAVAAVIASTASAYSVDVRFKHSDSAKVAVWLVFTGVTPLVEQQPALRVSAASTAPDSAGVYSIGLEITQPTFVVVGYVSVDGDMVITPRVWRYGSSANDLEWRGGCEYWTGSDGVNGVDDFGRVKRTGDLGDLVWWFSFIHRHGWGVCR